MKKGELLHELYIESITIDGFCLSRVDGLVIFLRGGAPGDTVSAVVRKVKKTFLEGHVVQVHQKSADREFPFCTHFELCGGCIWQHINYKTQLHYKQKFVQDSLDRIGHFTGLNVLPIIPCERTREYRNKLEFTFTAAAWLTHEEMLAGKQKVPALGFHLPRMFDKIFDVHTCHLQPHPSNAIRLLVKQTAQDAGIPFFNLKSQEGFLRTLTIRTTLLGEVMVILQVAYEQTAWVDLLLQTLLDHFPQLTSINYVVNTKRNDTFYDLDVITWRGTPYITECVKIPDDTAELHFRIGPQSFYQTNSEQACWLYAIILEMTMLQADELAYDLYTGVGTIANFLALRAQRVLGIELVAAAIENAKENARLNGISNIDFFAGDICDVFTEPFLEQYGYPDVIVIDPPRAGMHKKVCEAICQAAPKRLIYVSCNPATQARDLQLLSARFDIDAIQPVDMFPHTKHVENIVRLIRR